MDSEVYFHELHPADPGRGGQYAVRTLVEEAGFHNILENGDLCAIKLHVGEEGNLTYLSPVYVREIVDFVKARNASPYLTDTNTLYTGSRHNAVDHILTAVAHGFDLSVVGAPLIIADGLKSGHFREIPTHTPHFDSVRIAGDITDADSMIVLSHFKGHGLAGFGGAIKNLAMGCAPISGKRDQHIAARPLIDMERCIGCGTCVETCGHEAVDLAGDVAYIDNDRCFGCGECLAACPEGAIDLDWEHDIPRFIEYLAEYAYGAARAVGPRIGYVTFLTNITPECDCLPWSGAPIVPDVGVLASFDPVAIDAAAYDLVNAQTGNQGSALRCNHAPGADKFRGVWPRINGARLLSYAEEIGLGTRAYRLIRL